MLAPRSRRWCLAAALLVAAAALALLVAPAGADTPTCSAVLFLPVDEDGAYEVEQPDSAPGAIFCDSSVSTLQFGVADTPDHGSVGALQPNGLGGARFDYLPAPGFAGADAFALSVDDGEGDPVSVRVDVSVRPAGNDAPACSAHLSADSDQGAYVVEGGGPVSGWIDCFDDEGSVLDFAVEADPEHGTLGEIQSEGDAAASFTYLPDPGYQGSDQFALVANDGAQDSAPATVEIDVVAAVNDLPRCGATLASAAEASGAFEIEQGETVHGAIACVDEEDDPLDFGLAIPPGHGVLAPLASSGDGGADVAYTPAPAYLGFDHFRIDVSDGVNPAVPVTTWVRVIPARDDPPTCTAHLLAPVVDGAYRVAQGATVGGELDCEDDEGAPLDYAVASPPRHGSITEIGDDGHFSYTASASYAGADEIALVANDGGQDSQAVTLEIAIASAEGEPPRCEVSLGVGTNADEEYVIERDTEAQGRIVCEDTGADLALTVAAVPVHGSISAFEAEGPTSAAFSYAPAPGYTGADAFGLAADDGATDPQPVNVVVQVVEPSGHAPHCQARLRTPTSGAGYEVESGESVSGMLTCFDADGDELSFSIPREPGHGSVAGLEPAATGVARFTYTADGAWTGPDSFELVAGDGLRSSDDVEVDVEVVPPVDDPPECAVSLFSERQNGGFYPAEEGEANPGTVVCVDDEGQPLGFSVVDGPKHGVLTGLQSEGEWAFFDYEANSGYGGPDAVTLRAMDPAGGEDVVGLELEVGPAVNTAPVCTVVLNAPLSGGSHRVATGASASGEVSCADAEQDLLAFAVVQSPSRGVLSAFGGTGSSRSFTYTAASDQAGPDQFSLTANDGHVDSAAVVVAVEVEPPSGTGSGTGGGGSGAASTPPPSSSSPPVTAPRSPSAPPKPKAKKCRKGFKKKKARGKVKCVKKAKKHKAKR
jgi:large repetitive protein